MDGVFDLDRRRSLVVVLDATLDSTEARKLSACRSRANQVQSVVSGSSSPKESSLRAVKSGLGGWGVKEGDGTAMARER